MNTYSTVNTQNTTYPFKSNTNRHNIILCNFQTVTYQTFSLVKGALSSLSSKTDCPRKEDSKESDAYGDPVDTRNRVAAAVCGREESLVQVGVNMNAPRHSTKVFILRRGLVRVQSSKQFIFGRIRKLQLSHGPTSDIKGIELLCERIMKVVQLCTADRHNHQLNIATEQNTIQLLFVDLDI